MALDVTKGIIHGAADAVKAVTREAVMPAVEKLIPQGAAEVTQALFTGNGYVPYGPTEKPVGEPDHGVHGAPSPHQEMTAGEAQATREAGEHQNADQWFGKAAEGERQANAYRTPAEQDQVLDRWQGMAQASRESHAERGTAPPMWSVMNREEMREAFAPTQPEQTTPDIAGQTAKDQSVNAWRDRVQQRDRGRSR